MAQYTIKELEHLSGIKAHTIRIWEQRYNVLCPQRTDTNIRYYSDADLKTLLNISLLNEQGYKISKIAKMTPEQLKLTVQQLAEQETTTLSHHINSMVTAMIDMDEERFDKSFSTVTLQLGFQDAMLQVLYPFLHKIGILWQTNNISPAHEHFVSNLVRQKLIVAIDGQVVKRTDDTPTYLLYLPEGELHEIALLFMNYLIRARHYQVIYLGQNLPFEDLKRTYEQLKPDVICTVLTIVPEREFVQEYIERVASSFPEAQIYFYGYQAQHSFLNFPKNTQRLSCIADFEAVLKKNA
ncbi:MerR family transcriptional regulator [Pontibacter amylolyticus]|uniref:MerR family transcriptional regulator n=1 Tax=Pontibacter amylolyticus TaxID=1424080 RepID=A0ABQ1VZ31_9BACT|nr:MerR family transcriptional regulator [Pontibacter amylolyticus]GGG06341.1 MerR family transcriptional regulator [Pontibacter amylolyticus]